MPTVIHYDSIELECVLELELGEPATEISPAVPPTAYLVRASVDGHDILPLLSRDSISIIEEGALWSMLSSR